MWDLLPVDVRMFYGFRFMLSLSPERSLRSEGSVNVCKTIIKHTFSDASFVSNDSIMSLERWLLTFEPIASTSNASTYKKLYLVNGKL